MSMRRTIGISLACLVTSACAIDKTPQEESISHYPGETAGLPQGNGETPTGESPGSAEGLVTMVGSPTVTSESGGEAVRRLRTRSRWARRHPRALLPRVEHDWNHSVWESCLVQLCGQADRQWRNPRYRYRHRGASIASTRLLRQGDEFGNGQSVVVKINDRGPYTRGRILDLSPRAADALDMKRVGVAEVVLEPLINQAGPTLAVFLTSDTALSQ